VDDHEARGDIPKALIVSKSALRIFQENPDFAEANWDLFYDDGVKKIKAIVGQCDWEPSADVLTEWTTFEVQLSSRIAGKEAR